MTVLERLLRDGPHLSAGIVAGDLLALGDELGRLEEAGVLLAHVDVMDGVFCPTVTVGTPVVKAISGRLITDVHLMVSDPLPLVPAMAAAGADMITFHVESTRHPHRVLAEMRDLVPVRGVALNPGTPVQALEPLIDDLELILVLAVDPGWSGQPFAPRTPARVTEVREMLDGRDVLVGVDGGIDAGNIGAVSALPVDLVMAGSAVFAGGDTVRNARRLTAAMRAA